MRKYKYGLLFLLFVVSFLLIQPHLTKDCVHRWASTADHFNPFVKEEKVYIRTAHSSDSVIARTTQEEPVYVTTSYDNHGQARKISYQELNKHVASGRYLEVVTKGQNVRSWREILPAQVPVKARDQLR
ncbi:YxeA family protein [Candidatus Enterococcus ferrettii]|uniref:YxeA family protein n=1 Tax=Candidatus Enterococcus ferrettii TaxID=2815324 RepID=A0ABV0ELP1_9ENTE|nr:YxeA family protein [Enterococcus sp. 665A]MBO1341842.1 YxeA family protein [Enterococcus sp. 665A]